ncbi:DUF4376 domain-containing protein [Mesorhizobium sp.]|uniref:DUF4376 domain-containing protein n=1 Tax=Mesorhizobium sp. TaxID=1871066 RepID=UPI0025DD6857|nr:DUF4376 domain-containing protein [Mesorhizobium sp.]
MSNHVLVVGGVVVQSDRSAKPPQGYIEAPEDVVPGYRYSGGAFSLPVETLAAQRAKKLASLADRRWRAETGGITVGGSVIATDRDSTSMLTAAFVTASADAGYSVRWKVENGVFVTLSAEEIIAISAAVRAHVQDCFDREDELTADILAAASVAALAAIDIESGWPS